MTNYSMEYLVLRTKKERTWNPKNMKQFSSNMKPFQRTMERMSHSETDNMGDITEDPDMFNTLKGQSEVDNKYDMDFLLFMSSMYDLGRDYRRRLVSVEQEALMNNWFVPDVSLALENNWFIPDRTTAMRDYITKSYNYRSYYRQPSRIKRPTKMSEL